MTPTVRRFGRGIELIHLTTDCGHGEENLEETWQGRKDGQAESSYESLPGSTRMVSSPEHRPAVSGTTELDLRLLDPGGT